MKTQNTPSLREEEIEFINNEKTQRYKIDCIREITSRENKSIQNRIKLNMVRYSMMKT